MDDHGSHQGHSTAGGEPRAWYLRNGNRGHVLTREERARGGYVKAAKRRARADLADAADSIMWSLRRAGEDDAAQAVQELFLPHTLERPWESKRKSPLAKARERIAELEALVEELLDDAAMDAVMEKLAPKLADDPEVALDAVEKVIDVTLGRKRGRA